MKPLDQFLSSKVLSGDMDALLREYQVATDSFHRSNQFLEETKHKVFVWCDSVLWERESLIEEVRVLKGRIDTIAREHSDQDADFATLERNIDEVREILGATEKPFESLGEAARRVLKEREIYKRAFMERAGIASPDQIPDAMLAELNALLGIQPPVKS